MVLDRPYAFKQWVDQYLDKIEGGWGVLRGWDMLAAGVVVLQGCYCRGGTAGVALLWRRCKARPAIKPPADKPPHGLCGLRLTAPLQSCLRLV